MVPACKAVRHRREIAANLIGDTLALRSDAAILSIAAGHLREMDDLGAGTLGPDQVVVAIDQDPMSLSLVKSRHSRVDTRALTISDFIRQDFGSSCFDAVYALGLFDYLTDKNAIRLLKAMVRCSRKHVLIGNFHPNAADAGYMEVFMDWKLAYRTSEDLMQLANNIVEPNRSRTFSEPAGQIAFLELNVR